MINTEFGETLLAYSKQIARLAKLGDKPFDGHTAVSYRAHNNAWRLTFALGELLEHAKESDQFWTRSEIAFRRDESLKERSRLLGVAKSEDMQYFKSKLELDKMLAKILADEKSDPKAKDSEEVVERIKKEYAEIDAREAKKAASKEKKAVLAVVKKPAKKKVEKVLKSAAAKKSATPAKKPTRAKATTAKQA